MQETSTKPYLIRALHEWCTDNGYTPHIVVKVDENTVVPYSHVHDGQITLNVGLLATNQLHIGNEYINFQARFNGITEDIFVPIAAVSAIYARETNTGMGFEVAESAPYSETDAPSDKAITPKDTVDSSSPKESPSSSRPSHLKIIK